MMTQVRKPVYKVPSMAEITKIPKTMKVASLFSGCGGSSLGYKLAGVEVVYANEFIPEAIECYRANHPDTYLDTRDVREITARDILDATNCEIDILDGSPPCQTVGKARARCSTFGNEGDCC